MSEAGRRSGAEPPQNQGVETPIAQLWSVAKGASQRTVCLYTHPLGFELRVVDQDRNVTYTKLGSSEPECMRLAAIRQQQFLAKGWMLLNEGL